VTLKPTSGFTLIEVLAALLLFALAILGITQGQSGSVNSILRSESMTQAAALAEQKMTEIELELQKKNFESMKEEEKGEYKDEKLQQFKWIRLIEPVDVGCFLPDKDDASDEQQGFLSLVRKIFEKSIRKIVVRVEWMEGAKTRSTQYVQLYVRFEDLPDNF